MSSSPNCPFCHKELWQDGYELVTKSFWCQSYSCGSISCMVNNDFPRYKCTTDRRGKLLAREYALDKFYVRVYGSLNVAHIYHMKSCALVDKVAVPRALWLNIENFEETLDKLKMMAIFS